MKIFIDTANLDEIREANDMGILDGGTTNPSLVSKEGHKDFRAMLEKICNIVDGDVSAEVVSTKTDDILKEGRNLQNS
jgi:transaldolase